MTRSTLPFFANDISMLARSLHRQLSGIDHTPGHLELLNMLARAVGSRNFQDFRAQNVRGTPMPVDANQLRKLTRYFDSTGRLIRWPTKFSHREPCLWVMWSRLPSRKKLTEPEVNELLYANHCFEDPALLRREMKERKMVVRKLDGSEYRRVERKPPMEALALIQMVENRGL